MPEAPAPTTATQLDATLTSIGDKVVIAIHGIGDQYKNATVRSVVSIFGKCFERATAVPLGGFYGPDGDIKVFRVTAPPDVAPPMDSIGFVEGYWADIPRRVQAEGYTIEETKHWARTVVERVQAEYSHELKKRLELRPADYLSAIAALEGMIEAIGVIGNLLFLAEKLGFPKFELERMLTAFVGDVQLVADFANYRDQIRRQVSELLEKVHKKNEKADLYIVSHSEGTVVALVALLRALSASDSNEPAPEWIKQVRGLMTIGSPIDKHLILWPRMWESLERPNLDVKLSRPIQWRNYYDFADPVGFNLDTTRDWLKEHGWTRFFEFGPEHDHGFARYFLPGKAHNDYWNDPYVFGHFIRDVFDLRASPKPKANGEEIKEPPKSRGMAKFSSYFTPYLIIAILFIAAVAVLYTGVNTYLAHAEPWGITTRHVVALCSILAGTTVASRILCLTRHPKWKLGAVGIFALFAGIYASLIGGVAWPHPAGMNPSAWDLRAPIVSARMVLGTVIAAGLLVGLTVICDRNKAFLQRWPPIRLFARGLRPLLIAGAVATLVLVLRRINHFEGGANKSLWPLILNGALFLYLWWLAGILFDLTFTWQRYIRGAVWQKHLRHACNDRVQNDKARAAARGVAETPVAETT